MSDGDVAFQVLSVDIEVDVRASEVRSAFAEFGAVDVLPDEETGSNVAPVPLLNRLLLDYDDCRRAARTPIDVGRIDSTLRGAHLSLLAG